MIKAIVFDLQGVVVHTYAYDAYIKYLASVSGKSIEFIAQPSSVDNWKDFELGKVNLKEFEERGSKITGIPVSKLRWVEFYEEGLRPNKETIDLIKRLRAANPSLQLVIFSNIDDSRYAATIKIVDEKLFDRVIRSSDIGARKPDLRAYKTLIEKLGLKPEEIVFTDDNMENVNAAKAMGLHALLFKNTRTFERQLVDLGLLSKKTKTPSRS